MRKDKKEEEVTELRDAQDLAALLSKTRLTKGEAKLLAEGLQVDDDIEMGWVAEAILQLRYFPNPLNVEDLSGVEVYAFVIASSGSLSVVEEEVVIH